MEITQKVMDVVEAQKGWSDDIRQDLYVRMLEGEDIEFLDDNHLLRTVNAYYANMLKSGVRRDIRRKELMDEFADTIILNTAPDQGDDPLDILSAEEEVGDRIDSLSPLLYDTLVAVAVDGLTAEQIAEADEVSPNTVYQRLWEAKKIVKGE